MPRTPNKEPRILFASEEAPARIRNNKHTAGKHSAKKKRNLASRLAWSRCRIRSSRQTGATRIGLEIHILVVQRLIISMLICTHPVEWVSKPHITPALVAS